MAEVNLLGDRDKPEYVDEEGTRTFLNVTLLKFFICFAFVSPTYFEAVFYLLYSSNGVTAVLFQLIINILLVFPWVVICLFIGLYTKKNFLIIRYMAPLLKCDIVLHFVLSIFFAGCFNNFPGLTRFIYGFYDTKQDNKIWKKCYENFTEQLKYKDNCSISRKLMFPSICHMMKTREIYPVNNFTDDSFELLSGILLTLILALMSMRAMNIVIFVFMVSFIINYGLTLVFTSIRVSQKTILKNFLHFSPDFETLSDQIWGLAPLIGMTIGSLVTCSPLLVMIGSILPVKRSPAATALHFLLLETFMILFYFYEFLGNVVVLAEMYGVKIDCVTLSGKESFHENTIATRREALYIYYEDQGRHGRMVMSTVSLIMFRFLEVLYMGIHSLVYLNILSSSWRRLRNSKWLRRFAALLICTVVNSCAHMTHVKDQSFEFYVRPFVHTSSIFFGVTFTWVVCVIYGIRRLNIDHMFLYGFYMAHLTRILPIVLTLLTGMYFMWHFYNWVILKPLSVYDIQGFQNANQTLYYPTVTTLMAIVFLCALFAVLRALFNRNLSRAFFPSEKYGPWSPTGYKKHIERKQFHPETAVRYEEDYYRCSHHCWLNNDIIEAEIQECEKTFQAVKSEIEEADLNIIAPEIYEQYEEVLKPLQTGPRKVYPREIIKSSVSADLKFISIDDDDDDADEEDDEEEDINSKSFVSQPDSVDVQDISLISLSELKAGKKDKTE